MFYKIGVGRPALVFLKNVYPRLEEARGAVLKLQTLSGLTALLCFVIFEKGSCSAPFEKLKEQRRTLALV